MSHRTSLETTHPQESEISDQKSHALHYGWVFWFMHRSPGQKITNYESAMKKIATFHTVIIVVVVRIVIVIDLTNIRLRNSGLYIVTFVVLASYQISVIIICLKKVCVLSGR